MLNFVVATQLNVKKFKGFEDVYQAPENTEKTTCFVGFFCVWHFYTFSLSLPPHTAEKKNIVSSDGSACKYR